MTQAFDCEFVYKNNLGNKNLEKKHLSPSRRRALCCFFVQTGGGCNQCCRLGPLRALGGVTRFHGV